MPLFFLWPLCTTLGTCRPVTTEKLPFHTCRGQHMTGSLLKKKKKSAGGAKFSDKNRLEFPHHERWDNWLLKLSFKSVHQLLSFGVVKRQNTWRETQRQTYLTVYFIKICFLKCVEVKVALFLLHFNPQITLNSLFLLFHFVPVTKLWLRQTKSLSSPIDLFGSYLHRS